MTTDRTRAIVEAAERLARAMNLDVSPHGSARYDMSLEDGLTPEADDALLVLARALALPAEPAPAWTSRPPTESGWYFARWGGAPAGVVRVARGYDESDPTLHLWTMGEELCEPLSEVEGVEWWPMPIQPPPET